MAKGRLAPRKWKTWEELEEEKKKATYKEPVNKWYNNKYKPAGSGTTSNRRRERLKAAAQAKEEKEQKENSSTTNGITKDFS